MRRLVSGLVIGYPCEADFWGEITRDGVDCDLGDIVGSCRDCAGGGLFDIVLRVCLLSFLSQRGNNH